MPSHSALVRDVRRLWSKTNTSAMRSHDCKCAPCCTVKTLPYSFCELGEKSAATALYRVHITYSFYDGGFAVCRPTETCGRGNPVFLARDIYTTSVGTEGPISIQVDNRFPRQTSLRTRRLYSSATWSSFILLQHLDFTGLYVFGFGIRWYPQNLLNMCSILDTGRASDGTCTSG